MEHSKKSTFFHIFPCLTFLIQVNLSMRYKVQNTTFWMHFNVLFLFIILYEPQNTLCYTNEK